MENDNPNFRQPEITPQSAPNAEKPFTEQNHSSRLADQSLTEKLTAMWKAGLISKEEFLSLISKS